MKNIVLLNLLCLLPYALFSQGTDWGIGIIKFPETEVGVSIYSNPKGNESGYFEMSKYGTQTYGVRPVWRDESGIGLIIPESAQLEIDYEKSGLLVFESREGHVKIFDNNRQREQWLSLEDLREKGFEYLPWIDFMTNPNQWFLPYFYGMNLREAPNTSAPILVLAKGEQFEITPTGKVDGFWAEVIIEEYDSVYCESPHNLVKSYIGWIKILDDAGYPNIWFYTRGC